MALKNDVVEKDFIIKVLQQMGIKNAFNRGDDRYTDGSVPGHPSKILNSFIYATQ